MSLHPLAGKPAPYDVLTNIPRLICFTAFTDPSDPAQKFHYTSGHRLSLNTSFNKRPRGSHQQAI